MIKKGILLGCWLGAAGCLSSELLVDVSGIGAGIDQLEIYVVAQSQVDGPQQVSQRVSVTTDVQKVAAAAGGHYKLTLDHQLALDKPGVVQVLVGGLSKNCLRGFGAATGELQKDNSGYSTFDIPLAPELPNDMS